MSAGGVPCSTSYSSEDAPTYAYTFINLENPIDVNGNIDTICIKSYESGVPDKIWTVTITPTAVLAGDLVGVTNGDTNDIRRIIIFRDDETNYNVIAINTITVNSRLYSYFATSSTPAKYHSGKITTNTPKSEWVNLSVNKQVIAYASLTCSTYNDVYVNSSTGNDSACGATSGTPVQTFARAYALLNSAGTIHVLNSGADFSAETVTLNKSFSIDLNGSSGNFYMPKAS